MSECLDCPVYLRGLVIPGAEASDAPTIVARSEADFLQAVLDDIAGLRGTQGRFAETVAKPQAGEDVLKLFPPVQRTFNLALLETGCDVFGEPRLDPARIESAGLVVRRVHDGSEDRRSPGPTDAAIVTTSAGSTPFERAQRAAGEMRNFLEAALGTVQVTHEPAALGPAASSAVEILAAPQRPRALEKLAGRSRLQYEAWTEVGSQLKGWETLNDRQLEEDPDPERRRLALRSGNRFLDELLADTGLPPSAEAVAPLFVAPPEVCEAAGRTVLYGLIPVTGSDLSDVPQPLPPFPAESVAAHLSPFLHVGGATLPRPRETLVAASALNATDRLPDFILLLRQLAIELGAFPEAKGTSSPVLDQVNQLALEFTFDSRAQVRGLPSNPFRDLLLRHLDAASDVIGGLDLFVGDLNPFEVVVRVPAGDFLRVAAPVLVERLEKDPDDGRDLSLVMPDRWPAVTEGQARAIQAAVTGVMNARVAGLAARSGRFDEVGRLYVVQAFIRVRAKADCPPVILWSEPSEPFQIAEWYESSGVAPTQVRLPDVADREFLKKIKPNVAFVMPESLFNLVNGNAKELALGNGELQADKIGLQWICGFSIPIITICALIVL